FFEPKSVAGVGAGERLTSSGGAVLRNLIGSGYAGRIVPVNPRGGEILGLPAATSLSALDAPAELAVLVVRPDLILDIVDEAAATGHRNVMILAGGFREAGEDGAAREAELLRRADAAGITIFGPNCAGIVHLAADAPFAATFFRALPPGGAIAAISQSGAIAEEIIAKSRIGELPVGTVVSVGNAVHLEVTDYLEYLGDEDSCRCVLLYIESIADPDRFRAVARKVAAKKPVVALMGGGSDRGASAVRNHTGGAAMPDAEINAYLRDCGVIRVRSVRRLLLAAKGFGLHRDGIGPRVLLLSNSGGPGVITTDQLRAEGLEMPDLPDAYAAMLRELLPGEAAVANPIDLLADAREDRFGPALEGALAHGANIFDAILTIHVLPFMVDGDPVIDTLSGIAKTAGLPCFHSMMGTLEHQSKWFARMEAAGVPAFNDSESMAETAGILAQYPKLRAALV
ncbi:MAG: CoA-binding protein, partial [Alphaproteobacteria bacterium]